MADQSSQSILIDAPPAAIMAVIADFPAYPEWTGSINTCEVRESHPDGRAKTVHFVVDAGVVRDDYILEYDWDDDDKVSWSLVKGQLQKKQQGSYVLAPSGRATRVTYSLTVDLNVPMLGVFKRKAEKVIMDTALNELKKRVETAS
jgi:hypothetical protein